MKLQKTLSIEDFIVDALDHISLRQGDKSKHVNLALTQYPPLKVKIEELKKQRGEK